jgi:hypothetical protein
MVFGGGEGELFTRFTIRLDVIGHELTHGVTEDVKPASFVHPLLTHLLPPRGRNLGEKQSHHLPSFTRPAKGPGSSILEKRNSSLAPIAL